MAVRSAGVALTAQAAPFPHARGGDGPPVLLVPGLGGTAEFWAAQLPALAARFTVLVWDQRGSGVRAGEPPGLDPRALAAEVLALAATVGRPAVLVGHSMGGAVCLHAALARPDAVAGLVLSSSWAAPAPGFAALLDARRQILETAGAEAYLVASAVLAMPGARLVPELFDVGGLRTQAGVLDPADELARLDALASHAVTAELAGLDVPVELICADDDRLTPPAMAEALARALTASRLTRLPVGGHLAPRAAPVAFNAALLGALARLLPAG